MTTLPNMGLTLPTRGDAGAGGWGDTWDADAALIDAHDHTTGKGPRVPSAGLNIDADVPFSALYAPTQLHRVQFSSVAGGDMSGATNKSLFVSDGTGGFVANELYWRNSAGNSVQLTSGNSINTGLIGAIGGDYSTVGAQLNYEDSGKRYTFKEGTSDSNGWARLAAGDLRLYPFGGTGTFYVGHAAPVGLAASYTATWPAVLPGSTQVLQLSNAGAITASNTFANAVTCSSTLTSTGLITATAGVTCASGQSVTVSGAGVYKHGAKYISWCPSAGTCVTSAGTVAAPSGQPGMQVNASSTAFIPLPPLPEYAQLNSVEVWFSDQANQLNAVSGLHGSTTGAASTTTTATFSSLSVSLAQFGGASAVQIASGLTLTPTNAQTFWVKVDTTVSAGIARIVVMRMTFSVP